MLSPWQDGFISLWKQKTKMLALPLLLLFLRDRIYVDMASWNYVGQAGLRLTDMSASANQALGSKVWDSIPRSTLFLKLPLVMVFITAAQRQKSNCYSLGILNREMRKRKRNTELVGQPSL